MTARIATDSVIGLPPQVTSDQGITIVPLDARFAAEVHRDDFDLTFEQSHAKLLQSEIIFLRRNAAYQARGGEEWPLS